MSTTEGVDTTRENKHGVKPPETDKPNTKRIRFNVDTTKANVVKSDDGLNTHLQVPISSLKEDRDGDEFDESGMNSLIKQADSDPVGLFPNHGQDPETAMYDYREIFGSLEGGDLESETAMGNIRLLRVSPDSDELVDDAKTLVNLIEQDMPVGFSIGFGWDEKDATENENGGYTFHDLDLMELSAVGIPSNPEAVVQAGADIATSLKSAGVDPSTIDTDELTKTLTESIKTMSESKEEDEEEEEESVKEEEEEEEKNLELDEETVSTIQNAVQSGVQAHAEAMVSDIMEGIIGATENMDEEEETESSDEEEEEDKDSEVEGLKSELEELKAELETVKTDAAESAGRKDGMVPAEQEESEEETEEKSVEASNTFEEALAFED